MGQFPTHPAAVDAAFLSKVLGAGVARVQHQGIGNGLVGDSARFDITYAAGSSGPASIAGKFPAADETSAGTAKALRLYEKEVGFYRDIAPHVAIRTPKVYFAEHDPASGDFLLLMEDCGPAEQGDQLAGCTYEQALTCMRELAALHGPSYGKAALTDLPILVTSDEVRAFTSTGYVGACAAFAAKYAGEMTDADLAIVAATGEKSAALWQREPDQIQSIVHGDFRLDNMLFAICGGAEPMVTLDWQTVVAGNPLTDLGYFMGAGIGEELRRKHSDDLIAAYAEALKRHGGPNLTDIETSDGYAHGALHGVTTAVFSAAFVEDNPRAKAIFQSMAQGACSLVRELDALRILET
ncbi:MAG: phosphotransferase [Erythrobacter sp.]